MLAAMILNGSLLNGLASMHPIGPTRKKIKRLAPSKKAATSINNTQPNPGDNMNNRKKIAAAKKAYELDAAGQLWTTPRGARPITQDAVLVIVNGLAYRLDTDAIKTALTPKPKRTTKKKEQ